MAWASSAAASDLVVIDGDTLRIGEQSYRLHGIDSPEAGQRCNEAGNGTWPCGTAATNHMKELVTHGSVQCDNRGVDDFDRIIAVCFAGATELNAAMVSSGNAWAFRTYSDDYVGREDEARASGIGIWQAPTQTAEEYRAQRWEVAEQEAPEGCPIKGNISDNGHIYHPPWSPWYSRTKVSLDQGERWFCSEREALDAGWRAPIWGG